MESSGGATSCGWTEAVEDLMLSGEVDQAISLLESTVSNLEIELEKELRNDASEKPSSSVADQLSTALHDLSRLYYAGGFSLKADQTVSRALQIKLRKGGLPVEKESLSGEFSEAQMTHSEATSTDKTAEHGYGENCSTLHKDGFPNESGGDDDWDWEAIADRAPDELLAPQSLPGGISKLSFDDSKTQSTKRRGRGPFSYNRHGLYSDHQSDEPVVDDTESDPVSRTEDRDRETRNFIYGTSHVLVLTHFPLSTRTTDLEKMLVKFKDCFVIRWVNDTTALAVFKTPSLALEAINSIQCPFTVRALDKDDELLITIPPKDLEPPRPRPQTSARTAQRLIAQGMGIKLPSTFGLSQLRDQEAARKNQIISRQNMREDAWGKDDAA